MCIGPPPRCAGTSGMCVRSDRFIALVFSLALSLPLCVAFPTNVRAESYQEALLHFTGDSFDQTIEGINGVAASGSPLAATVISALQEGRLFFSAQDKAVFFRDRFDRLTDAATGEPVTEKPPADLAPVRLNNRLRRIIEAVLGSLTLLAPDPARRLEAAQAVFRSRDASALAALDQAIAKETNARIKQAMIEARAAVVLYLDSASDEEKLDAIAVIRQRSDQVALALLGGLPAT